MKIITPCPCYPWRIIIFDSCLILWYNNNYSCCMKLELKSPEIPWPPSFHIFIYYIKPLSLYGMWLSYAFVITFCLHTLMLWTAKTVGILFPFDHLSLNLITRNSWSLILELPFFNEKDVLNHRKQWLSRYISLKYIIVRKKWKYINKCKCTMCSKNRLMYYVFIIR